jgi:hypothetical protein
MSQGAIGSQAARIAPGAGPRTVRPDWMAPGGSAVIVNVVDDSGHDDIERDAKGIRADGEYIPVEHIKRTYGSKRK